MVYTITFNPSLDYKVRVNELIKGSVNRTEFEHICAGGKGINVSMMLNNLGVKNTALGFVAGFTGEKICDILNSDCVDNCMWRVPQGLSRINVKIRDNKANDETEVNGMGPILALEDIEKLKSSIACLNSGDFLVLAGSVPVSVSDMIYKSLVVAAKERGVMCVVDATGTLLKNALAAKPFLVKPNNHELGELFGVSINSLESAAKYAQKLQESGANNVLVSMGDKGAVLVSQDGQIYKAEAPKGIVVDTVGAGDSMVAGFIAGFISTKDYKDSLRLSVGAGSASAFCDKIAAKEQVDKLAQSIEIFQIG